VRLLFVNPPLPAGASCPWYLREENHAGPDSTPMAPHFGPAVLGCVRAAFRGPLEVKVMDGLLEGFSPEGLAQVAREWGADAAFVLLGLDYLEHDARFAELPCPTLAQICPVTVDPAEAVALYALKVPYLIFGGETEMTVAAALNELTETGRIEHTPGVFINREGEVRRPTGAPQPSDMGAYPLPAYDLFNIPAYLARQTAQEQRTQYHYSAFVKTMKGCLFQCVFCTCSSPGQQARCKGAAQVIEEIKLLAARYGFRRFVFLDSEFGVSLARAKDICRRLIESGLGVSFLVNNRIDLMDAELVGLMKAAGCELVRYGIESADPKVMARINKRVDLERAAKAIRLTRAAGIQVNLFFLVGLPGEDAQTPRLNARFIIDNQADSYSMGRLFLIPNTALYRQLKEEGRLLARDWQRYRRGDDYQFRHDYYRDLRHIKRAERELLNAVNRARLTSYRMGRLNERLYAFISSFGLFSIHAKERLPRLYYFCKGALKKVLNA